MKFTLEETVASLKSKLEEQHSQMKELKERQEQQASQLKELRQHHQNATVSFGAFLAETGPFDEKSSYLLPVLAAAGGLLFLIIILSFLILLWRCRRSNRDYSSLQNNEQTSVSVKKLKEEQKQLASQLKELQQHHQNARVSFSASLRDSGSGTMETCDEKKALKYENVITNVGGAYDYKTGVFTAPVKGVYLFSIYGLGHGHDSTGTGVCLYKNEKQVITAWSRQPKERVSVSNSTSLELERGDEVCVKLWPKSWIYDNENNLTTFSGHLLFPM